VRIVQNGGRWGGEALQQASGERRPEYLFYLLVQAARRRETIMAEAMKGVGLSLARWGALAVIDRLGACAMHELSLLTAIDRTTLTRTVDQLVSDGLVERRPHRTDRRLILLGLTPHGSEVVAHGHAIARSHHDKALAGIPEQDLHVCVRVLQRVVDNQLEEDEETAYGVLSYGPPSPHIDRS
jgi:DNA-binding MarR family transcriptional regulator